MGKLALFLINSFKRGFAELLIVLGLGWISFSGLDIALDQLKDALLNSFNNLPSDVVMLLGLAGFGECIALYFGVWTAILTYSQVKSLFGKVKKA